MGAAAKRDRLTRQNAHGIVFHLVDEDQCADVIEILGSQAER